MIVKNIALISISIIATQTGLGLAHLIGQSGKSVQGWSVLFICAIWVYLLNWLAYIPASIAQTEKYYDLIGAVSYISMISLAIYLSAPLDLRAQVVSALVILWAVRLGSYLFKRIRHEKSDHRFDELKTNPFRFLITWTVQAAWVVITSLCALVILSSNPTLRWDIFATIGLAIWVFGFTIEVVADWQKSQFKRNPENKGRFIQTGLWSRSQHPNYFGEIVLWIGIAIIAFPILSGWQYLALLSPVFVILLLLKISGIPILQKTAKERWGNEIEFQKYHQSTPILIPKLFK